MPTANTGLLPYDLPRSALSGQPPTTASGAQDPNNANTGINPVPSGVSPQPIPPAQPTAPVGIQARHGGVINQQGQPTVGPPGPISGNTAVTNGGYNNIPGLFNSIYQSVPSTPYQQTLNDAIMRTIQQNQAPVNGADPLVQSIMDQAQRARDANSQMIGERLYGQGVPASSGAWDNAVAGFNQQSQETTQNQLANMIQQRQQNLLQALSTGSSYLTNDQTQRLQSALAQLNAMLQNSQYYAGLGTQANEFATTQNANAVNTLTGG